MIFDAKIYETKPATKENVGKYTFHNFDDGFSEQAKKCSEILSLSGLSLIEKRHSKELKGTEQYNQIWRRKKNDSQTKIIRIQQSFC